MAVKEVNGSTFETVVLKSEKPVVVDFNAAWCGPCRMMKPVLETLSVKRPDVLFAAVNVDDDIDLAERYQISSIPCLVLIKNGAEAGRIIGYRPMEDLERFLG